MPTRATLLVRILFFCLTARIPASAALAQSNDWKMRTQEVGL